MQITGERRQRDKAFYFSWGRNFLRVFSSSSKGSCSFMLFTIASFLCSLAQTGPELILFRIIQALGAAFLFSNSAAILTDAFDAKERGKALGLNQVSIVIGSALGLVLGGILTETLGWRAIFWVNIPIGIFAIIWSRAKLRELGSIVKGKIDWAGNLILVVGLTLVML